jgi:hypothetical protein
MDTQLMSPRCDHCRAELGVFIQRYWRMRFCSDACKKAYQGRLEERTRDKIRRLDRAAFGAPEANGGGVRSLASFGRRFAA